MKEENLGMMSGIRYMLLNLIYAHILKLLARYYGDKGGSFLTEFYPHIYIFILKYFFGIFGYIDVNGRWLSLIAWVLYLVPLCDLSY